MNRYYFLVVWMNLFAMPCFAMLNPAAFGNFGPPQQPVENQLSEPEEAIYTTEQTSFGYQEPELYGLYAKNVITADEEPPAYTREQAPQFPPQMVPKEFEQSMESGAPFDIEGLLPTPQAPAQPSIPDQGTVPQIPTPSAPSIPPSRPLAAPPAPSASSTVPSAPVTAPSARPQAPGKAHESITKANSKLSSALRRLDAIKGYYKEINQEERKVIKKEAEGVLKEYQTDITKFVRRIEQVKNELGGRADQSKLAPFNTFIDLANKLSQGIKRL